MKKKDMEIVNLKTDIAEQYVKKFKNELGRFKSLTILPIENKIKTIIASNGDIGDKFSEIEKIWFWWKIVTFVSPRMGEKIYDFVKEKKEILAIKNTKEELEVLKQEVMTGKKTTTAIVAPTTSWTPTETNTNTATNTTSWAMTETSTSTTTNTTTDWTTETNANDGNTDKTKENADKNKDDQKKSKKDSAIKGGMTSFFWSRITYRWLKKIDTKASEIINKGVDVKVETKKMREMIKDVEKSLRTEANFQHYTLDMQENFTKTADGFKEMFDALDEDTMGAVIDRWKLGKKIPMDAYKKLGITKNISDALKSIDPTLYEDIIKTKDTDELRKLLKDHGIEEAIPEDVLVLMKNAENATDLKWIIHIVSFPKYAKLLKVVKWFQAMSWLDVAFCWFDVFTYCESMKEADMIEKLNRVRAATKRSQARTQLILWFASVAAEFAVVMACVFGWLEVWWPIGFFIGVGIWALFYGVSEATNTLYYDVRYLFEKNDEDYIKQLRTENKQAVLQIMHNLEYGDVSLNEKTLTFFGGVTDKEKRESLENAREMLILDEWCNEVDDEWNIRYPLVMNRRNSKLSKQQYIAWLTEDQKKEYEKQYNDMFKEYIDPRMEYISKATNDNMIFNSLKSGYGMYCVSKILAESDAYAKMVKDGVRDDKKSFDKNKEVYKAKNLVKLKGDAERFNKIEAIYKENKKKFREMYQGACYYKDFISGIESSSDNYAQAQKILSNIEYLEKYYAYVNFWVPLEDSIDMGKFAFSEIDFNYLNSTLLNLDTTINSTKNRSSEKLKVDYYNGNYRKEYDANLDISDKVSQNVIYRIAKEIHWYTGDNNRADLINYFSPGNADKNGLYYDDKRYFNNDRAIDQWVDITSIDKIRGISPSDVEKETDKIIKNRLYEYKTQAYAWGTGWGGYAQWKYVRKSFIDTPTENIDEELMDEVEKKMRAIIEDELIYKTSEKKKEIEKEIVEFINTKSKDDVPMSSIVDEFGRTEDLETKEQWYIELPFYLIIDAKKTGIGDLQHFMFKKSKKKNTIVACSIKSYITDKLDFSQTNTDIEKEYLEDDKDAYDRETKKYINYVDEAINNLVWLTEYSRYVDEKWTLARPDDLDIPTEILGVLDEKIKDRQKYKKTLLDMKPELAKVSLLSTYQEIHDYFENMYMGMLRQISTFSNTWSNDLDSSQYFAKIEAMFAPAMSQISIDKKGDINLSAIESVLDAAQFKTIKKIISTQKIDDKTIVDLAKSNSSEDKELAIQWVKQAIKSVLEAWVIKFKSDGNIDNIYSWDNVYSKIFDANDDRIQKDNAACTKEWGDFAACMQRKKVEFYTWLAENRFAVNNRTNKKNYLIASQAKITPDIIDYKEVDFKKMTPQQKKISDVVEDIKNTIKDTDKDKKWLARWEMTYDWKYNNTISSWQNGKTFTVIDPDTLKIKDLNITFSSVRELVYCANIINRIKWYYLKQHPTLEGEFFRGKRREVYLFGEVSSWNTFYVDDGGVYDTDILVNETVESIFPSLADNDTNKEKFAAYVNTLSGSRPARWVSAAWVDGMTWADIPYD